jgi:hypothetical protein
MAENPHFCYAENDNVADEDSPSDDGKRDPVFWLLRRLSQIAKAKGSKRRMTVFKCYAAFVVGNFQIVAPHLELMLEGLHRSSTEAKNESENRALSQNRRTSSAMDSNNSHAQAPDTEHGFAEEVLGLIEEQCPSPSDFLKAYAEVKRRAHSKKQKRKAEQKLEDAQNPQAATERRTNKKEKNKQRKKRRAEELRIERRGGEKKYRHRM